MKSNAQNCSIIGVESNYSSVSLSLSNFSNKKLMKRGGGPQN